MKAHHDKKLKKVKFTEGHLVLWFLGSLDKKRNGLTMAWPGPYELLRMYDNGSAQLRDLQGQELPERVNRSKLKLYHARDSRSAESQ